MKIGIKAVSAFYLNYPVKDTCQWYFQLGLCHLNYWWNNFSIIDLYYTIKCQFIGNQESITSSASY
jgi:hypothetical protein